MALLDYILLSSSSLDFAVENIISQICRQNNADGVKTASQPMVEILAIALPVVAFVIALFPSVFEETGRFVAFKTVLRRRFKIT